MESLPARHHLFPAEISSPRKKRAQGGKGGYSASIYTMTRQNVVGSLYSAAVNPPVRWVLPDPNQVVDLLLGSKRR